MRVGDEEIASVSDAEEGLDLTGEVLDSRQLRVVGDQWRIERGGERDVAGVVGRHVEPERPGRPEEFERGVQFDGDGAQCFERRFSAAAAFRTPPSASPRSADIASTLMKSGAVSSVPATRSRTLTPRGPASMIRSTSAAESTTITGDQFSDVDVGEVDAVVGAVGCVEPFVDRRGAREALELAEHIFLE